jgi:hypothetical protein
MNKPSAITSLVLLLVLVSHLQLGFLDTLMVATTNTTNTADVP